MKRQLGLLILLFTFSTVKGKEIPLKLIYDEPAKKVSQAIPLGNGRLGMLVYGGVAEEKLSLNDDTFWSGEPKDWNNPNGPTVIPQIREALALGNHELADKLAQKMQGPYNQSYQPLGELLLKFEQKGEVTGYSRMLDLNNALAKVSYQVDGVKFTRTMFASYPGQAIAILLESDKPGALNFQIEIGGKHQQEVKPQGKNMLIAEGRAPAHVDPSYLDTKNPVIYDEESGKGMRYSTLLKVVNSDGVVSAKSNILKVSGASKAVIYLTARTSFNGFDRSPSRQGTDYRKQAAADLKLLEKSTYPHLLKAHIKDYQRLFNRVELVLGDRNGVEVPFKEILQEYRNRSNPKINELIFQLGRYLIIAGSRAGSQPLNLQGIWNEWVRPPWSSNYTLNINTQMNYWPVLPANLAECHQPLLNFVEELAKNGVETARVNYGIKGWVAHHNADLWRQSSPVGDGSGEPSWANFNGGGTWLTFDFWEHYQYSQDTGFLRKEVYPLLKGSVEFAAGWLKKSQNGAYIPPFTVSSEATYITPAGYKGYVAQNSAQDIALYGELMVNFIRTCDILNLKDKLYDKAKDILANLEPYRIDSEGKIQEWLEDGIDRPKGGNKNHLSQLIGFYPGRHLILQNNQAYIDAVRRTLEIFGPSSAGWMFAWEIGLWARLKDAQKSYELAKLLLNRYSPNDVNPDGAYQIDWQMGYTAGVCEMLLQSHNVDKDGNGVLEMLPALPKEWPNGHIYGLRARGGYEVNMDWKNGVLVGGSIRNVSNKSAITPKVTIIVNGKRVDKTVPFGKVVQI